MEEQTTNSIKCYNFNEQLEVKERTNVETYVSLSVYIQKNRGKNVAINYQDGALQVATNKRNNNKRNKANQPNV